MAATPLVSVVIIFLDAEAFLAEAVASALEQDHPRVEVLLVDDGSTDGSSATARGLAAQYPGSVRVLEHPGHVNLGMSASRNAGLAAARGDLVAYLDADDTWAPDHLSGAVDLLSGSGAGWLTGAATTWRSWAGGVDERRPVVAAPGTVLAPPAHLIARLLRGDLTPTPGTVLAPRALLQRVGGSEAAFRSLYEDQVLLAKLELAAPVVVDGRGTARYRQHAASSTARDRAGRLPARRAFLTWLTEQPGVRADPLLAPLVRGLQDEACDPCARPPRQLLPAVARRTVRRPVPGGVEAAVAVLRAHRGAGEEVATAALRDALDESLADLRGDVLEVGAAVGTVERLGSVPHVRSVVQCETPPDDSRFDVVLAARVLGAGAARTTLAALRDRLVPGGVLHVVVDALPGERWSASPSALAELAAGLLPATHVVVEGRGNHEAAVVAVLGLPADRLGRLAPARGTRGYPVVSVLRGFRPLADIADR